MEWKKKVNQDYYIENLFPIEPNGELKFMKPLEKEAYAIILEKAWAGKRGQYKKLNSGRANDVLNTLLGTSCRPIYNQKMAILTTEYRNYEIDTIKYINGLAQNEKNDPEVIYKNIKNAFKTTCPIITTSINMDKGGHEYSILGIYTEINPHSMNEAEFVMIKNPWRGGGKNKELEKLNDNEINKNYIPNDVKVINGKYKDTGVFYMPKEYFKKWFRDVTICLPNYGQTFKKVENSKNLYDAINNFYGYDSNKNYFDISQKDKLITVNIISKKKFEETNKKIIQINNSEFAYVYDKASLSSIWSFNDKVGITPDYCFVREAGKTKYELCKNPSYLNFKECDVYIPKITMIKSGDKYFCTTELKKISNINEFISNKKLNKKYLENKNIKELDLFKSDFEQIRRLDKEIQRFLRDIKYISRKPIINVSNGWINVFQGVTLCCNEFL